MTSALHSVTVTSVSPAPVTTTTFADTVVLATAAATAAAAADVKATSLKAAVDKAVAVPAVPAVAAAVSKQLLHAADCEVRYCATLYIYMCVMYCAHAMGHSARQTVVTSSSSNRHWH
jgi:C4-dicarboxylate-specific signal transduction histidine kinase